MVEFTCEAIWSWAFIVGRYFFITASISVMFLLRSSIFPGSVLEGYTFLRVFTFLPSCPFYWHIIADSSLLWSFIFLCCILWFTCLYFMSSLFSFGRLYIFKNLSISSPDMELLIVTFYDPFYFCVVYCNFSIFTYNFIALSFRLFFFLDESD